MMTKRRSGVRRDIVTARSPATVPHRTAWQSLRVFGLTRKRHAMRPAALEITVSDFAFGAGRCRSVSRHHECRGGLLDGRRSVQRFRPPDCLRAIASSFVIPRGSLTLAPHALRTSALGHQTCGGI